MQSIIEYLQSGHIANNRHNIIHSYEDLEPGDYVAFEFTMGGLHYSGIAKFSRIGKYNNYSTDNSVVFDWAAVGKAGIQTIKFNTHNSLSGNYKITYKTPTDEELELCEKIDKYIKDNELSIYIGKTNDGNALPPLGTIKNNKIEWNKSFL